MTASAPEGMLSNSSLDLGTLSVRIQRSSMGGGRHEELREERALVDELTVRTETLRKQIKYAEESLQNGVIPRYIEVPISIENDPELRKVMTPLTERRRRQAMRASRVRPSRPFPSTAPARRPAGRAALPGSPRGTRGTGSPSVS